MAANHQPSPWTDERVALLKEYWETQHSCNWIAVEINRLTGSTFTRNAIIGRISRMGLSKRVIKRQPSTRPHKPRDRHNERIRRELNLVDLFADALPPPEFLGVPWIEAVDSKGCMYPEGDGKSMLFCVQPRRNESSYCEAHRRICYWKPDRAVRIGRAA